MLAKITGGTNFSPVHTKLVLCPAAGAQALCRKRQGRTCGLFGMGIAG